MMFYRGHIFLRILLAFVLIGLLFAGGYALYRAGFSQGYSQATLLAASDGENPAANIPVYPAYGYGYPGFHYGFFPFFPIFGFCLFGFLLFALFFGLFRPRHWGYPPGSSPEGYWHGKWGPPPWGGERSDVKPGEASASEGKTG